ncbi:MAG: hypothetical protein Q9220_007654 [cf. Caloplaca sp. 1 TL-2023]
MAKRRHRFALKDLDVDLQERRARNDRKLKSTFESIFEKYSKDFSDVGDVINFTKDEVVLDIDNGYIRNMRDEKDPGKGVEWSVDPGPGSVELADSDDDPLVLPGHVIRPDVSISSQEHWSSQSQFRTKQSPGKKRSGVSTSANRDASIVVSKRRTLTDWQINSTINNAGQLPSVSRNEYEPSRILDEETPDQNYIHAYSHLYDGQRIGSAAANLRQASPFRPS